MNLDSLDLNLLVVFDAVTVERSVTKAAAPLAAAAAAEAPAVLLDFRPKAANSDGRRPIVPTQSGQ